METEQSKTDHEGQTHPETTEEETTGTSEGLGTEEEEAHFTEPMSEKKVQEIGIGLALSYHAADKYASSDETSSSEDDDEFAGDDDDDDDDNSNAKVMIMESPPNTASQNEGGMVLAKSMINEDTAIARRLAENGGGDGNIERVIIEMLESEGNVPGAYAQGPGVPDRRRPTTTANNGQQQPPEQALDLSEIPEDGRGSTNSNSQVIAPATPAVAPATTTHDDEELAQARLVVEGNEAIPQIIAEPQPSREDPNTRTNGALKSPPSRWCAALMMMITLLGVVIVIIVIVVLTTGQQRHNDAFDGDLPTEGSIEQPTTPAIPMPVLLLDLNLPDYTIAAILDDRDSPQARAYEWLRDDPSLDRYSATRKLQRFVLATLYHSAQGPDWAQQGNWVSYDTHECYDWFNQAILLTPSYEACNPKEEFHALALVHNRLMGKIPPELGLLQTLEVLVLANNYLAGSIPDGVWELPSLKALALDSNALAGELKPEMVKAMQHNMVLLDLSNNLLRGTLPSQLGLLSATSKLSLNDNMFSGTIPPQLGNLPSIEHIALSANAISGMVPPELFTNNNNWGKLTHLELRDNPIMGSIPSEIALLTNLKEAYMYHCELTGWIPSEMGLLSHTMIQLVLAGNSLSGPIPEELWQLTMLETFLISTNGITGSISSSVGLLSHLHRFQNHDTPMRGDIPSELGRLTALTWLELSGNGTIPQEVWDLPAISKLTVTGNLTGSLPEDAKTLQALVSLNVSQSLLSGTVPSGLCTLEGDNLSFNCSDFLCGCDCPCAGVS